MLLTAFEEYFRFRSTFTLSYIASSLEEEIKYDDIYLFAVSEALKPAFILKAVCFCNWRGTEKQKVKGVERAYSIVGLSF